MKVSSYYTLSHKICRYIQTYLKIHIIYLSIWEKGKDDVILMYILNIKLQHTKSI